MVAPIKFGPKVPRSSRPHHNMSLPSAPSAFPTQLRGISADFSEISLGLEEIDLGSLSEESLIDLLKRFLAIDPVDLIDADPEIIITGRRGRYSVKNSHHKLTLRPVADPMAAFVELSAEEIPSWMDQTDSLLQPEDHTSKRNQAILLIHQRSPRQYYVAALMIISLGIFGATVYYSFRPAPINDEAEYQPVKNPQKIATLNKMAVGRFTNIDASVKILVQDNNRLVLIKLDGPQHRQKNESTHPYKFMTNAKGEPVLYTSEIGVINLINQSTLRDNGDAYRRTN